LRAQPRRQPEVNRAVPTGRDKRVVGNEPIDDAVGVRTRLSWPCIGDLIGEVLQSGKRSVSSPCWLASSRWPLLRRTEMTTTDPRTARRWLSKQEAADYLGVNLRWLRRAMERHELPFHRRRRRVLFDVVELDSYIKANRVAEGAPRHD
jgi:excisionase family DNA binding protein